MQGIHERVRHLQGDMEIRSAEGGGTTVIVTIPESVATVAPVEGGGKAKVLRSS